jgi:hypothetical protein
MQVMKQFSIFMVNKPGVLAQVLSELAKNSINIVAMTLMDSAEHGVLRVVLNKPDLVHEILTKLNLTFNETNVLCVNLANKAGALASVVEKLAKHHVNITYAYVTAGARGGRTTGVLKVSDIKKASKLLEAHLKQKMKAEPMSIARRSKGSKKK